MINQVIALPELRQARIKLAELVCFVPPPFSHTLWKLISPRYNLNE